uniref:Uncharacterized protein n=3 Tax=Anopheles albimanus TaxID=7167 RepID=A0A182FK43_ANOAL
SPTGVDTITRKYKLFYLIPNLDRLLKYGNVSQRTDGRNIPHTNGTAEPGPTERMLLLGPSAFLPLESSSSAVEAASKFMSVLGRDQLHKLRHFSLGGRASEQREPAMPVSGQSRERSQRYYIYGNGGQRSIDVTETNRPVEASEPVSGGLPLLPVDRRSKRRSAVDDVLSKNITLILENLLKRYENSQMPTHGQGVPTVVQTNILIRSMGPVSELDMDYSMDCYFRQYWRDKRLSFHGPIKSLSLSIKMLERIWRPDTYFYNGKHSHVHTITVPNKLLRLSQDGEILYSMRLTIKASCLMQLRSFPMDRQSCPLVLGSYAYSRQQLIYRWKDEDSVNFVPGMTLSQFDLISFGQKNYTFIRREGEFSVLHVSFNLQRHTGYFLIQVYVPCILIVVLSWVSFWIHREATSDRVGLGITTVLTLSTISLDSRTDLPKVRYATALDWFLLMSFFYCIATLLEFAGVHYFTKVGSGEIPLDEEEWEDLEGGDELRDMPALQHQHQHLAVGSGINVNDSPRLIAARRRSSLICPIYNDPAHMFKPTSSHLSTMERTTQTEPPKEPTWKQIWLCFLGDDQFRRRRQREASARGGGNRHINSVSLIDQAARILFPTSFTFFNILYWLVYYTYQADFTWSPLKEV